ncbi:protein of unknown function DUF881 [Beutenbergia cavernae DSM 12333]|uniref:Membrane spanning protein DUF881 n=1 Tax=Beutenbergia cavernae (strain ATCC BAA-8 / DSM 12333 / CCUG 43141 / JCM 11478 / NBRC 16432 / NCIMB 13614 / HKI 0122) TaxID=471853 RepID=C5BUR4_BEUC1|nr:DUF881 domain-containing protein [Beutenbergia cavernae]ACQ78288.1 protein of unknown function DUF881 [Beutenbergia cavernae DSM 12333]
MTEKPARARTSLAVGVVAAVAGVLFATSASVFADDGERRPQDLRGLVAEENSRLGDINADVEALRSEVAELEAEVGAPPQPADADTAMGAGFVAVTGPGLVVELSDAPTGGTLPQGARADDLVVHQQDLEAVVNALWAGGAEAMTIQGQRVTSTTAVRCVGNVLLLQGKTYSPPYRVAAIGDPAELRDAVDDSPTVQVYLEYVEAYHLGWSVTQQAEIEMPAYDGDRTLTYSTVPGEGGDGDS